MNITTLLNTLRNAIHDDADTRSWCGANYTRAHKVYVGVDTRNPPGETDYPCVHLFPVAKTAGYELEENEHVLGITCGVYNETASRVTGYENAVEMVGIADLETFRKYVETAVAGAIPAEHFIQVLEIEYEVVEFFPFFLATMELNISQYYAQGDDPFE